MRYMFGQALRVSIITLILGSAATALAQNPQQPDFIAIESRNLPSTDTVVARVEDAELTFEEVVKQVEQVVAPLRGSVTGVDSNYIDFCKAAMDGWIEKQLFILSAREEGVSISDEEVDQKIRSLQGMVGEENFSSILEERNADMDDVRDYHKHAMLIQELIFTLYPYTPPPDEELRKEYEENKEAYERIRVSHILFKTVGPDETPLTPEEQAKAREKAQKVLALAKEDGADFAELAKEYSEDPSAVHGGDLGQYISRNSSFDPAFTNAAFALKEGAVSGLVTSRFGYHIIKLLDREIVPFEQAKEHLIQVAGRGHYREARADLLAKLRKKYSIESDIEGLKK